jgi:hypothetical protein
VRGAGEETDGRAVGGLGHEPLVHREALGRGRDPGDAGERGHHGLRLLAVIEEPPVPSDQAGNGQLDHYLAMLNFQVKTGIGSPAR